MRPSRVLPANPPATLRGRKEAEAVWRRLMRVYGELEGEIVTRLDIDLLVDYCLLAEQVSELDAMRKTAVQVFDQLNEFRKQQAAEGKLVESIMAGSKIQDAFESILKLDGRVDRKRDLMHKLRQSLYLTPRARAGTAPKGKEKEQEPDPLEQFLNEVTTDLNGEAR